MQDRSDQRRFPHSRTALPVQARDARADARGGIQDGSALLTGRYALAQPPLDKGNSMSDKQVLSEEVFSQEVMPSANHSSFGDYEYDDGEIILRRGDRLDMPPVSDPPPLARFMPLALTRQAGLT